MTSAVVEGTGWTPQAKVVVSDGECGATAGSAQKMPLRESLPFIAYKQSFAFPNGTNVLAVTLTKFGISSTNRIGSFGNDSRVKMTSTCS